MYVFKIDKVISSVLAFLQNDKVMFCVCIFPKQPGIARVTIGWFAFKCFISSRPLIVQLCGDKWGSQ